MQLSLVNSLLAYILSILFSFAAVFLVLRKKEYSPVAYFIAIVCLHVVWTIGYLLQTFSADIEGQILWNNVQFFSAVGSPALMLIFSFDLSRGMKKFTKTSWITLLIIVGMILFLFWGDEWHHLYRTNPELILFNNRYYLNFESGPSIKVYYFYVLTMVLMTCLFFWEKFRTVHKKLIVQILLIFLGFMLPWMVMASSILTILPVRYHLILPMVFGFSNILIAVGLSNKKLIQKLSVSRKDLVEKMQDGFLVIDHEFQLLDFNKASEYLMNISLSEFYGQNICTLVPELGKLLKKPISNSEQVFSSLICFDKRYIEVFVSCIDKAPGKTTGYLLVLRDVSNWQQNQTNLEKLAAIDPLTGLYNRKHFFINAEKELERSKRYKHFLSFILFDVDQYKLINDRFGHFVGDQVLCHMIDAIKSDLREVDLFARLGGDEFVIMLPETNIEAASVIAERLRMIISDMSFSHNQSKVQITASFGISSLGHADQELMNLMEQADQAMYLSKKTGRNCISNFPVVCSSD